MAAGFEFYHKKLKDPRKNITMKYPSTQKSMKTFSNDKTNLLIFSIYYKSTPEGWNDMIFKIKNLNAILKTGARGKNLFLWQISNWDFYKEKL